MVNSDDLLLILSQRTSGRKIGERQLRRLAEEIFVNEPLGNVNARMSSLGYYGDIIREWDWEKNESLYTITAQGRRHGAEIEKKLPNPTPEQIRQAALLSKNRQRCECQRCGLEWVSRLATKPKECRRCKAHDWDTPRLDS